MTFDVLGNLGDFVGGIAVVITLIYLAYQVKLNTKSTHSASYQAIVSSLSSFSRELGFDKEGVRIFSTGLMEPELLDATDKARFAMFMTSLWRSYENIHFQYASGAIPEEVWRGWAYRIASTFNCPGSVDWWSREQPNYSEGFQKFINDEVPNIQTSQAIFGIENSTSHGI